MTNLPPVQHSDDEDDDDEQEVDNDNDDDDVDNDNDDDVVDNTDDDEHLEVSLEVHLLQLLLTLQRESVERLGVRDAHLGLVLQHIFTSSCSKIFFPKVHCVVVRILINAACLHLFGE